MAFEKSAKFGFSIIQALKCQRSRHPQKLLIVMGIFQGLACLTEERCQIYVSRREGLANYGAIFILKTGFFHLLSLMTHNRSFFFCLENDCLIRGCPRNPFFVTVRNHCQPQSSSSTIVDYRISGKGFFVVLIFHSAHKGSWMKNGL